MKGVLVDSCVILDLFTEDHEWAEWSESVLAKYSDNHRLYINPIIYSEVSIAFVLIEEFEKVITECGFLILPLPKEALFLAGKAFVEYKKRKGNKFSPLPDFFIGAHAAVNKLDLITRDVARFTTYFPAVNLISPSKK